MDFVPSDRNQQVSDQIEEEKLRQEEKTKARPRQGGEDRKVRHRAYGEVLRLELDSSSQLKRPTQTVGVEPGNTRGVDGKWTREVLLLAKDMMISDILFLKPLTDSAASIPSCRRAWLRQNPLATFEAEKSCEGFCLTII